MELNSIDVLSILGPDSPGFVIKNQCFENSFSDDILKECEAIIGPNVNEKLSNISQNPHQYLAHSKFGSKIVNANDSIRGDYTTWLTPDMCKNNNFKAIPAYIQNIIKLIKPLQKFEGWDVCDYSAQLAIYPGNGTKYLRHLDAGPLDQSKDITRKFTIIFYLNKDPQGGELRVYLPSSPDVRKFVGGGSDFIDISPKFGRLVLFRSDIIEHEVLPSISNRIAITIWASGKISSNQLPTLLNNRFNLSSAGLSDEVNNAKCETRNPPILMEEKSINDSQTHAHIFVNIAAYRDSECKHTVNHMFEMAEYRNRVFVGIVWQSNPIVDGPACDMDYLYKINVNKYQVRIVQIDSELSRGPCWARHICNGLWQGEKYILQIDSHMRFRRNWDSFLISQLELARSNLNPKPILTTYPMGYELPCKIPLDVRPTILVPQKFDESGILRQSAKIFVPSSRLPVQSTLWAAGFSFTDSRVIHDVPYDPLLHYLFFGEEMSMAVRLFTHGYSFFAPSEAVIYHLWTRSYRPVFQEVQRPEREQQRLLSINKVFSLFDENCSERYEQYGIGKTKSTMAFEKSIGIDIKSKTILPEAYKLYEHLRIVNGDIMNSVDDQSQPLNALPERFDNDQRSEILKLVGKFL